MARIIMLICAMSAFFMASAETFSYRFNSTPLPIAIQRIMETHPNLDINFIYNELENYNTSATVHADNAFDALRQTIGLNPVTVIKSKNTYYLEALQHGKHVYTGRVIGTDNEPVAAATIVLLAPKDSTLLTYGIADADGRFRIPCDYSNVLAKLSCIGYKIKYYPCDSFNLGTIVMHENSVKLKDVVIKAPTMMMTDGNKTVISNVSQSYLGEQGNLINTLQWTPGLISAGDGDIVVPGIGRPAIYIDGRKISTQKELLNIPSQEIDRIEIIRDPGNKYPSGTLCVINITTKKHLRDFLSLNPSFKYTQRSKAAINTALNINFKTGKFSGLLGATYIHSGSKPTQLSNSLFISPNTEDVVSSLLQKTHIFSHRNSLTLFSGLSFELSNQSRLQLQYIGEINHSNRQSDYELVSTTEVVSTANYNSKQRKHNNTHNVSLGYYLDSDNTTFSVNGAYNSITRQSDEHFIYPDEKHNCITHPVIFETFLSNCEFNHETDFGSISGGYDFSFSKNKSTYLSNTTSSYTRDNNITINPYIGLAKSFSKITVEGSISYLYDNQRYHNDQFFSKHYSILSPFASVSWKHNRKKFTLSYRSNNILPTYYELSPSTIIIDSLNYYIGNQRLSPTKKNTIILSAGQWKGFSGSFSYNWQRNSIVECLYPSSEYKDLVIIQPKNIGKQDNIRLNISYNVWKTKYNISLSSAFDYASFKMPGNSSFGKLNKFSVMIMLNARYTLGEKFNIFTNSWYRSPYIGLNQTIGHTMALNIGISTSFFKKSLNVSLTGSDLFNKAVSPTSCWTYSNNLKRFDKFNYDGRAMILSVSYTLNKIKTKFEKSDNYEGFMERTTER